jgi:hypothetical protein
LRSHPTANPLLRQETFQIHYVSLPGVILAGISAFYKLRLRYIGGGSPGGNEAGHIVQAISRVTQKHGVALTEIILPWLTVVRPGKTVFRAAAVTGKAVRAGATLCRQWVRLFQPEPHLAFAPEHLAQGHFCDPAQPILRIDIVVAGIKAAIMFHRQPVTASFGKEA